MRRRFSYGSELSAGAAFVLAGFSSGTGVCARGGTGVIRNSECGIGARDERGWHRGSVAEFCRWFMSAFAVLPRRFPRRMLVLAVLPRHLSSVYPCLCGAVEAISSARVWLCGSIAVFCLRSCPALRGCRRGLRLFHARLCGAVDAFCLGSCPASRFWRRALPRFMPGIAGLLTRFALGSCLPRGSVVAFCPRSRPPYGSSGVSCLGSRSPCGSGGAVCPRFTPAFEVLLRCLSSVHACCLPHGDKQDGLRFCRTFCLRSRQGLRFCRGAFPRFTPGLAVLLGRFAFGSRLLFAAWRQTGRLAVSCVSIPPGRDRLRAFS